MQVIKDLYISYIVSRRRLQWKQNSKYKIVIAESQYFTEQSWIETFSHREESEIKDLDIVICKNKIDLYRHIPSADICFLYGLSPYLQKQLITKKMIYFPLLGLDFLKDRTLPGMVTVEQPPAFSAQTIAEYCIAMAITLTRNLHSSYENQFKKQWRQSNIIPHSGVSITRYNIGVLGLGRVGKEIASQFKKVGCNVIGCDLESPGIEDISQFFFPEQLLDFIKVTDILIIALPLNIKTKNMVNAKVIQALGKHKYIINISRGEIIDESALIDALKTKNLRAAALDVFEQEPLPSKSEFFKLNNVIITPHIAGNINLFVNEIQNDFISKTLAFLKNV